jgi:antigen flippase
MSALNASSVSMSSIPANPDVLIRRQPEAAEKHSYGQILKSSAMIGGSQVAVIAIGIVRTKVMAVLLGPAGVGLFGIYNSISSLAQSVAGMGVNNSGVRQIAEAVGSGDTERIARTAAVLRRTSWLLGLIGAALLVAFAGQIAGLSFGRDGHATEVAVLSIAVCLSVVSAGQGALIQGMRQIADLASMGVLGAIFGTIISIPTVYVLGEDGVVPSIVGAAAMTIVTSWWYSRKLQFPLPPMATSQIVQQTTALLKLGFAFMASGLMMMGSAYVVRIAVLRSVGVEGTGMYQSAWTLGGLYTGFILQAMGADFYPRLTASAHDNAACNRMVNEQARVGMLLAGPGVIATLTFAPLVVHLFYSGAFDPAVELLRWICLGVTLRVITWPMGFIILAKGRQQLFFWSELAWTVVHVGLALACLSRFGLNGAGIAFFGSYVFHGFLIYALVRQASGFRWTTENMQTGFVLLSLVGFVFCVLHVVPTIPALCFGVSAGLVMSIYSGRVLLQVTEAGEGPRALWRVMAAVGRGPKQ